jgi:hypothetical protein
MQEWSKSHVVSLMFIAFLFSVSSLADEVPDDMEAVSDEVRDLATGDMNQLEPFTPRVLSEDPEKTRRHTPLLFVESPWAPVSAFGLEVPEYSWAQVPGDPNNGDPFFYGRQIGVSKEWKVRYPSRESPRWKDGVDGCLDLDVPLEGGCVQRFRVLSHDRVIEIRFGITNGSEKPLRNLRCQICLRSNDVPSLAERWPTSSKFYSQGEIVTWDSLGQGLSWLNPYRANRRGQFSQSCFFLAPLEGYQPRNYPEKERSRKDLMWFNRSIDVPAIAKVSPDEDGRAMLVYSPNGRNAFYNVLVPCFHADPHMNAISPNETRWTSSFLILFEGELDQFFKSLTELHKRTAREEGYLDVSSGRT